MTEDQISDAVELVRKRGVDGVTTEFLRELDTSGDLGVAGLDPTFGLEFSTLEHDDMGVREHAYRIHCSLPGEHEGGEGEASTPAKASFLAFAEALEVLDLRAD